MGGGGPWPSEPVRFAPPGRLSQPSWAAWGEDTKDQVLPSGGRRSLDALLYLPISPYISLHLPISLYRWAARSRRSPPSAASASTRASPALCLCLISQGEGVARSRLRVIAHDARSSHPGQVRRALMARHPHAPRRTPLLRRRPLRPPRPRPPRGEPERDPPQRGQHRHEAVSVRRQLIVGL